MPANRSALARKKESDEANDWREGGKGGKGVMGFAMIRAPKMIDLESS